MATSAPLTPLFQYNLILSLAVPSDLELKTSLLQFHQGITSGLLWGSCLALQEWGRRPDILTGPHALG